MENKKHAVNKAPLDKNTPLTINAFEQLLGLYRQRVWEVKIAPTLVSSNSLSKLFSRQT
jgi:hypothetical protein